MLNLYRIKGEKYVTTSLIAGSQGQRNLEVRLQFLVTKILYGENTAEKGWLEHTREEVTKNQGKMAAAVSQELQQRSTEKPGNFRSGARTGGRGSQGRGRGQTQTASQKDGAKSKPVTKPGDSSSTSTPKAEVKCYNCNLMGHMSRDCPKPPKDKS